MDGLFSIDIIYRSPYDEFDKHIIRILKRGVFTSIAMEMTSAVVDLLCSNTERLKKIYEELSPAEDAALTPHANSAICELLVCGLVNHPDFHMSPWEFVSGLHDTDRRRITILKLASDEKWEVVKTILDDPRMTWALSDGIIASSDEAIKKNKEIDGLVNKKVFISIYRDGTFSISFGVLNKYHCKLKELSKVGVAKEDIQWIPLKKLASYAEPLINIDEWDAFVNAFESARKKGKVGLGAKDPYTNTYHEWIEI